MEVEDKHLSILTKLKFVPVDGSTKFQPKGCPFACHFMIRYFRDDQLVDYDMKFGM